MIFEKKFIIYMLVTFEVNIMILQMEIVGSLSIFNIYSNMKGWQHNNVNFLYDQYMYK
jgi:hypothetical protein